MGSPSVHWMESVTEPHNKRANYIELGESWARVDPKAATQWYQSLPDVDQDPTIMDRIFKRWSQYEPETAVGWLRQQPSSPGTDRLIGRYVREVLPAKPSEALTWSAKISDEKQRQSQMTSAAWRWVESQPKQALNFLISDTQLPQQTRDHMIQRARKRLGQ